MLICAGLGPGAAAAQARYRNPVTFLNATDETLKIHWIYEPSPLVLSVLTLQPGEEGLLAMPAASKLSEDAQLTVKTETDAYVYAMPIPAPGQPGPIRVQIAGDYVIHLAPGDGSGAASPGALRRHQRGGFPLRPK